MIPGWRPFRGCNVRGLLYPHPTARLRKTWSPIAGVCKSVSPIRSGRNSEVERFGGRNLLLKGHRRSAAIEAQRTARVDVNLPLQIAALDASNGRIAGLRGQPFVGPVSARKRAFTLSEAGRPSTRSGHAGRPRGTTRASWRTPRGVIAVRVANGSQGGRSRAGSPAHGNRFSHYVVLHFGPE
jgi:hypothetical protein